MGLLAKFRDRIEKSSSIEELEAVGQDFGRARGLSADEREKISRSLDRRFLELSKEKQDSRIHGAGPKGSLDATIDESGREIVDSVRSDAAKAVPLEVREAGELYKVPAHFVIMFDNRPYIPKDGMLWKLREYGYDAVDVEIQEEEGGFLAEARIYPKLRRTDYDLLSKVAETRPEDLIKVMEQLRRPTVAHATANKGNLKPKQLKWMREMAETRAVLRAARVYTGMGLSTPEEEPGD